MKGMGDKPPVEESTMLRGMEAQKGNMGSNQKEMSPKLRAANPVPTEQEHILRG